MKFLYSVLEQLTNGYLGITLVLLTLISVISAILVIIGKNPIFSVLNLITLFFYIACYLIFIGVGFIGLAYLLVYVGAVSILFLFILMLINVRTSELISETKNSIPLVFIISIVFGFTMSPLLPNYYAQNTEKNKILYVTLNQWENNMIHHSDISSIGNIMYTSYSIWLVLVSLILALAMVGAIIITIKQKDTESTVVLNSLERAEEDSPLLNMPPKPHAFISMPLQSRFGFKSKFLIIKAWLLIKKNYVLNNWFLFVALKSQFVRIKSWFLINQNFILNIWFIFAVLMLIFYITHPVESDIIMDSNTGEYTIIKYIKSYACQYLVILIFSLICIYILNKYCPKYLIVKPNTILEKYSGRVLILSIVYVFKIILVTIYSLNTTLFFDHLFLGLSSMYLLETILKSFSVGPPLQCMPPKMTISSILNNPAPGSANPGQANAGSTNAGPSNTSANPPQAASNPLAGGANTQQVGVLNYPNRLTDGELETIIDRCEMAANNNQSLISCGLSVQDCEKVKATIMGDRPDIPFSRSLVGVQSTSLYNNMALRYALYAVKYRGL